MYAYDPMGCETETYLSAVPDDHRYPGISITNDYRNMQTNESIQG